MNFDQRPCPTCRQPISEEESFLLAAFEPPDEEVERVAMTGNRLAGPSEKAGAEAEVEEEGEEDENADPTLDGFIVDDDKSSESDLGFEHVNRKEQAKPRQPNRVVVQDSDDDEVDELEEAGEAIESSDEEDQPCSKSKHKGKGKVKVPARPEVGKKMNAKEKKRAEARWRAEQEPSTKMMWLLNEINRVREEAPDDKVCSASPEAVAMMIDC